MTPNHPGAASRREILRGAPALVGAGLWLVGCRKSAPDQSNPALTADAVKQSLDALKNRLDELKKKFMALREQVETVPADLPGFSEARSRFYAVEEGRGTTDAKSAWLSGRLDAAIKSGDRVELEQISKDITATYDDIRKIEDLHVKMLHEVMSFQRIARRTQEAQKDAEKEAAAAAGAKSPRAKTKQKTKPSKPDP